MINFDSVGIDGEQVLAAMDSPPGGSALPDGLQVDEAKLTFVRWPVQLHLAWPEAVVVADLVKHFHPKTRQLHILAARPPSAESALHGGDHGSTLRPPTAGPRAGRRAGHAGEG